jgi:hypothetical protein
MDLAVEVVVQFKLLLSAWLVTVWSLPEEVMDLQTEEVVAQEED